MSRSVEYTKNVINKYKQRIEVMEAYLQGKQIEVNVASPGKGEWMPVEVPTWNWYSTIYRVVPSIPDSIDWTHVHPKFRYMARDEDGKTYLYTDKPRLGGSSWGLQKNFCVLANAFMSAVVGNIDWKESLVERPDS